MSRTEMTITLNAVDNASPILNNFASNVSSITSDVTSQVQSVTPTFEAMGTTVSSVTSEVSADMTGMTPAFDTFTGTVTNTATTVKAETEKMSTNYKGLATSLSAVATGAYGLYLSFDRVQDMSLQVDKANLLVRTSTEAVEKAQANYDKTLASATSTDEQKAQALQDLELAQERLNVNTERAQMVQENQTQAMGQFALMIVPQAITMIDGVSKAVKMLEGFELAETVAKIGNTAGAVANTIATTAHSVATGIATGVTKAFTVAQHALNSAFKANPIGFVLGLIALLVGALITAYETCEPFRNAVNAIGEALKGFFGPAIEAVIGALTAFWNNVLVPVGNALKAFWDVIMKNPILSWLLGPITMIAYVMTNWESIIKTLTDAWSAFVAWIQSGVDLMTGWFNILKGAWDATVGKIADGFGWISSQIGGFVDSITGGGAQAITSLESIGTQADVTAGQVDNLASSVTGLAGAGGAVAGVTAGGGMGATPTPTEVNNQIIQNNDVVFKSATLSEEQLMSGLSRMGIPRFQRGGTMPKSGFAILEAGEKVLPANTAPLELTRNYKVDQSTEVNINSPLVVIQGGGGGGAGNMRAMGEVARRVVFDALRSVRIQATSSGALTSSVKQYSTSITTTPMATPGSVGMVGGSTTTTTASPTTYQSTSGGGSVSYTGGYTPGTPAPYSRLILYPI